MTEDTIESNWLYTIPASVGTPPQDSMFLLSLNADSTFVFSVDLLEKGTYSGFYNAGMSSTSYREEKPYKYTSDGFVMIGEEYTDVLCLDQNSDLCIDYYEFVSVESVLTDGYLGSF